jgi:predicted AAA+ superfamily ATPase
VIGSNFPLWTEIIEENKCGICVNPESPEEIAKAINYILENPEIAKEMGSNGKKMVETKYNWNIEEKKLIFLLTGSSARKIRKSGVNLLAGRALSKKMFPLTLFEVGDEKKLDELIEFGTLPKSVTEKDSELCNEYLASYVQTYLKEEVFQEGLTRNLAQFSHFIELAGQYHGQILNFENIGREIGTSGDTIKAWFQILEDTLVGTLLPAYRLNIAKNETRHSRFYFFDPGVARASEGLIDIKESPERKGFYFEGLLLNELRAYAEVNQKKWNFYYYNTPSTGDVDFIIELRRKGISKPAEFITLEVKLSKKWDPKFEKMSLLLKEKHPKSVKRMLAIYLGDKRLTRNGIEIFPLSQFVKELWTKGL